MAERKDIGEARVAVTVNLSGEVWDACRCCAVGEWDSFAPLKISQNFPCVMHVRVAGVLEIAREHGEGVGYFGDGVGLQVEEATDELLVVLGEGRGGVCWRESELFQNSVSCCRERYGDTVAVFEAIIAEELVDV